MPLHDDLIEALRDHKARAGDWKLANPDHFVFGGDTWISHGKLDKAFHDAVKDAGIRREPGKRLSPHTLRHGFGSILLAEGEDLINASRWMGHASISTTEKIYRQEIVSISRRADQSYRERMRNGRNGGSGYSLDTGAVDTDSDSDSESSDLQAI